MAQKVAGGPGSTRWQMWVTANGSWICLKLDGETKEEVDYYSQLLKNRGKIEAGFGESLTWDPLGGYRAATVRWDNPVLGGYRDAADLWPEVAKSLASSMARLVQAAGHLVVDLPRYVPEEIDAAIPLTD